MEGRQDCRRSQERRLGWLFVALRRHASLHQHPPQCPSEGLQRLVTCIRPGTEQTLITNMLNEPLTFSPSPSNYN